MHSDSSLDKRGHELYAIIEENQEVAPSVGRCRVPGARDRDTVMLNLTGEHDAICPPPSTDRPFALKARCRSIGHNHLDGPVIRLVDHGGAEDVVDGSRVMEQGTIYLSRDHADSDARLCHGCYYSPIMEIESRIRKAFAEVRSSYETHKHVLQEAVLRIPQGIILELGAGEGSTPPLHEVCLATGRPVITLESERTWFERFEPLRSENHAVMHVPSWEALDAPIFRALPFAIAFVDHTPSRRVTDIEWLSKCARIIVVHDTESGDYGYEKIFGDMFRWKVTYKGQTPWTSVLSNFVDVSGWTF